MTQSLVSNLIHLVFSTKRRCEWIPETVQQDLYAYQAGVLKNLKSPAIVIGGVEDHVHMLLSVSKNYALSKIVQEVKSASSAWMKSAAGSGHKLFAWQGGYAGFSVSQSNVDQVRRYIENQREHHQKKTFQDELRSLFRKHQVEFDERYVWD